MRDRGRRDHRIVGSRSRLPAGRCSDAANILLDSAEVDFMPCSDFFEDTFRTFASQRSGRLSFVDAAIAPLARRNDPGFVATSDGDFRDLSGVTVIPD